MVQPQTEPETLKKTLHLLGEKERLVLFYLYLGSPVKELTQSLGMSVKMVSYYKRKVMEKFQLQNDKMLVDWLNSLKQPRRSTRPLRD